MHIILSRLKCSQRSVSFKRLQGHSTDWIDAVKVPENISTHEIKNNKTNFRIVHQKAIFHATNVLSTDIKRKECGVTIPGILIHVSLILVP